MFFPKAAAKGSFEKSELKTVMQDCHLTSPKVKTVSKDCHQRLPKFCCQSSAEVMAVFKDSSAEVMAVFKDCHQRLPKFC